MTKQSFDILINGVQRQVVTTPDKPLLWVLRDDLALFGTRYSCGIGICGICNIHLDGETVPSCTIPISAVGKRSVVTIEGLSGDESDAISKAWDALSVSQCGYCQPGQQVTATALLRRTPKPSSADIDTAMSSVLCRCGNYARVRQAILRASDQSESSESGDE